jgi:protein-S-isoprenylcysteine O-methyltransferase Ste14
MESQKQTTPPAPRKSTTSILVQGLATFVVGAGALGAVLSLLAGKFSHWQVWAFAGLFALGTASQGVYLAFLDPELLERRKQVAPAAESLAERIFVIFGLVSTFGLMIFCAFDLRFGWSRVPLWASLVGDLCLIASFLLYYLVFQVNSFASSSIQTYAGQKVIATGPYAFVRHPKYVGDLFLIIGIPLAIGSWWGLAVLLLSFVSLAWRILDEEKLLKKDLPGYVEYTQKVRYRLIPYIW